MSSLSHIEGCKHPSLFKVSVRSFVHGVKWLLFQNFTFHLRVICAVIDSLFYISWNQTTRFHTRFKGHHVQNLLVRGVTFPWKRVCLTHWQKLKTFPKDLSRKRSKISWKRSPLTISLDIRPMDYMTWILVKYFIFSRTKIFLNERLQDKFSWNKKVLEMLYHCYLRYRMWKNFQMKTGKLKVFIPMNLISILNI